MKKHQHHEDRSLPPVDQLINELNEGASAGNGLPDGEKLEQDVRNSDESMGEMSSLTTDLSQEENTLVPEAPEPLTDTSERIINVVSGSGNLSEPQGEKDPQAAPKAHKDVFHIFHRNVTRYKILHVIATTILFIIAACFAILALTPIVLTVLNSFMSTKEIVTNYSAVFSSLSSNVSDTKTYLATEAQLKLIPNMVSIEQYATVLFKSPMYIQKFWNSIFLVVPIVFFQMITGSLAAYSFARFRKKRREVLYFLYIILMLMPFQVTLVPNYLIADKLGILNSVQAIILPGIFSTFSVFLLTKYMRRIPSSYIEAAKLDGAGDWHIFTRICIPMCKSALYAMAILLFIDYWNMVEQPLILLPDPEKQPLSVFLAEINSGEVGIAFAASFIFMVPPLLLFLNGEQYLVEGISKSGLK